MRVYGGFELKQQRWLLGERDRLRDLLVRLRAAAISRSDPRDITHDEAASRADAIAGRLAAIDEALDRINSGRYGLCDICGSAIPIRRLEALPATAVCRDCMASQRVGGSVVRAA
jgi:DnaK suppressor protein